MSANIMREKCHSSVENLLTESSRGKFPKTRKLLLDSAKNLTTSESLCIYLHYLEGRPLSAVAKEMKIKRSVVQSLLSSGISKLRRNIVSRMKRLVRTKNDKQKFTCPEIEKALETHQFLTSRATLKGMA